MPQKKDSGLMGKGRGGWTAAEDRRMTIEILDAAVQAGPLSCEMAALLGVGPTTLQRWRRQFAGAGDGVDRRNSSHRLVSRRLTDEERQRILLTCNQPEFAALPPGQVVPAIADRGLYNSFGEDFFYGSESSFYRVLHAHGQAHCRGRARPAQAPRPAPRLEAREPNQLWSRKVVAWDVAEREEAQIAPDLVGKAGLRERIGKGRRHLLMLHADNGDAMRAATLETWPEMGVLQSFSRPRVSNDNPYSESLFRRVEYRPGDPRSPFRSKEEACSWACAFVDWYNHRHRHSSIRFVTPDQRHSGQAVELCRHRAHGYDQAHQRHPRHWSRSTRCWHPPEVVWIDPPLSDSAIDPARLVMAAWSAAEASSFLAVTAAGDQVPLGEIFTAASMDGGWGLTLAADGRGRTAIAAGSQLRSEPATPSV